MMGQATSRTYRTAIHSPAPWKGGPTRRPRTISSCGCGGNIVIPSLTGGYICSAVIEDVQGRVEPTSDDVTFSGGSAITKNLHLWSKGLLMGAGAKVLLACRGIFSDDDWTVLQTVGVNCFDKDTAIY